MPDMTRMVAELVDVGRGGAEPGVEVVQVPRVPIVRKPGSQREADRSVDEILPGLIALAGSSSGGLQKAEIFDALRGPFRMHLPRRPPLPLAILLRGSSPRALRLSAAQPHDPAVPLGIEFLDE
jgi:hypothetical protein